MPKTQWTRSTLHFILKRYQPLELFSLRSLLSTGDLHQYRCDDGTADSTSDELKQRVYDCRREILQLLDSNQLTALHQVATPVNWKHGEDVIIVPAVSDEEARERYPDGWESPRPYIRIVPSP